MLKVILPMKNNLTGFGYPIILQNLNGYTVCSIIQTCYVPNLTRLGVVFWDIHIILSINKFSPMYNILNTVYCNLKIFR